MKLLLMVGVATVALMGAARAQIPVTDGGLMGLTQLSWVKQAADMGHQLAQMRETFRVNVGMLGSLLRTIDPNNLAREAGALNPLGDVTNLTSGISGIQGITGMVNGRGLNMQGLTSAFLHGNNYYTSPYDTAGAFKMDALTRGGTSVASLQATATQMLTDSQNRLTGIEELQAELSNVQSEADLSALRGKIDAQNAALTANNLQIQSLTSMWQAQKEAVDIQRLQKQRQDSDRLLEAAGGGNGPSTDTTATPVNAPTPQMPASFTSIPGG